MNTCPGIMRHFNDDFSCITAIFFLSLHWTTDFRLTTVGSSAENIWSSFSRQKPMFGENKQILGESWGNMSRVAGEPSCSPHTFTPAYAHTLTKAETRVKAGVAHYGTCGWFQVNKPPERLRLAPWTSVLWIWHVTVGHFFLPVKKLWARMLRSPQKLVRWAVFVLADSGSY